MPDTQDNQRRAPARPKNIEDIDPRDDIRVRVVGTVLSIDDDSISVDDSTGSVDVFLEEDKIEDLEEGQRVRIFGRVLPTPDSFEIQGEIVQDFSDVDPENYSRIKKVVSTTE
jgi:hypothetical protein